MCNKKAATSGKDRFSNLPDELLRHVLSFLPLDDALQTCVLNTRWRDLWRRVTSLLFVFDGSTFPRYNRFKQLVKLVICLRGDSPLVRCEIDAYPDDEPEDTFANTTLLIDYALACDAEDLVVRRAADIQYDLPVFDMHLSLVSQHLKTLHLKGVNLDHSALMFSGCPVLEDLRIQFCNICARKILSMSLKRLCITYCSLPDIVRMWIVAPSLISLQMDGFEGLTPFLENMPLLEAAHVRLDAGCHDFCPSNRWNCDNPWCGCHSYPINKGLLFNGLSDAVKLELIAVPKMQSVQFLYRWDVKWCPIFGKLKTLLLNEWFTAVDLVCILRRSPVLEILTLKLDKTKNIVGATGAQETTTQSFVCASLKFVYIECEEVDERVLAILNILSTCGVLREQISITRIHVRTQIIHPLIVTPLIATKMCGQS